MAEFALDLDHDAITLLRRSGAAWDRIGEVRLDAPDFDAQLRELQGRAASLASGSLKTELVVPATQVLHLELEMEEGFEEATTDDARLAVARMVEARTAEEAGGVTFDWIAEGRRVHVAVVSDETLREAQAFARAYGFNPVRAWARPEPGGHPEPAEFGPLPAAPAPAAAAPRTPPDPEPAASGVVVARPRPRPAAEPARPPAPVRAGAGDGGDGRRSPRGLLLAGAAAGVVAVASALLLMSFGDDGETVEIAATPLEEPSRAPSASPSPSPRPFDAEPVVVPVPDTGETTRLAEIVLPPDPPEPDAVEADPAPAEAPEAEEPEATVLTTAREPEGTEPEPEVTVLTTAREPEPEEARRDLANYAATGIWETPPALPRAPGSHEVGEVETRDVAAPVPTVQPGRLVPPGPRDAAPAALTPPPPPGAEFALGEDGRVAPSPEGSPTPDGIVVFEGRPTRRPPPRPPETILQPGTVYQDPALVGFRPPPRPADAPPRGDPGPAAPGTDDPVGTAIADALASPPAAEDAEAEGEAEEEERPDGGAAAGTGPADEAVAEALREELSPAEVLSLLPRSAGEVETDRDRIVDTAVAASLFRAAERPVALTVGGPIALRETTATGFALAASARPTPRPADLPPRAAPQAAAPAPAVQASAAPALPSRASVARRATVENALAMNRISLVGVFGAEGARRALVRLPSGRFQKVKVGDRLDGGRVRAVQEGQVVYVRGGRNVVLQMPRG